VANLYGPAQNIQPYLKRIPELRNQLRAIARTKSLNVPRLVEDICIEVFEFDLPIPTGKPPGFSSLVQWPVKHRSEAELFALQEELRKVKDARNVPMSQLVLDAVLLWVDRNLWYVDKDGRAVFGNEFFQWYTELHNGDTTLPADIELPGPLEELTDAQVAKAFDRWHLRELRKANIPTDMQGNAIALDPTLDESAGSRVDSSS
jgi:hypothetical protein